MTVAKLKVCKTCGVPCPTGYCDKHPAPARHQKPRESSAKRGYNWRWQKFRERYLVANPFCVDCLEREGKVSDATDVHHIQKIKDAPHLKYELTNLCALCSQCHDYRSARGE